MCQASDFADLVASGALTADVADEVELLRAQHADAVQEKLAAKSKSRRLSEKVAAMEAEKTDLWRQLAEERREANKAITDAQAAQGVEPRLQLLGALAGETALRPHHVGLGLRSLRISDGLVRLPPLLRQLAPEIRLLGRHGGHCGG